MKKLGFLFALAAPVIAIGLAATSASAATSGQHDKSSHASDEKGMRGAAIGKAAPAFELKDVDGKTVKLADYKGKIVVLEWFNPECPVSAGCHQNGALKDQAARAAKDGVVWLAINSGAAGKEGSGAERNKKAAAEWNMKHPVLMDENGEVGHLYGAKTTPHMFVIDAKGVLVYKGAIDNHEQGEKNVNYVDAALADLKAGKPVATKETKSYGCGVKYGKPSN